MISDASSVSAPLAAGESVSADAERADGAAQQRVGDKTPGIEIDVRRQAAAGRSDTGLASLYLAASATSSPPVTARQLETDATKPMMKTSP